MTMVQKNWHSYKAQLEILLTPGFGYHDYDYQLVW